MCSRATFIFADLMMVLLLMTTLQTALLRPDVIRTRKKCRLRRMSGHTPASTSAGIRWPPTGWSRSLFSSRQD
ncbi:hypothetical protein BKA62DRAFT_715521 [Auriculariales sp. MPI-PUGE-AT-0066]|nr:hypothetical protein BKA62DRAFT_715521 [Auriculariales sp. MPI-PUGE-AT-0066]